MSQPPDYSTWAESPEQKIRGRIDFRSLVRGEYWPLLIFCSYSRMVTDCLFLSLLFSFSLKSQISIQPIRFNSSLRLGIIPRALSWLKENDLRMGWDPFPILQIMPVQAPSVDTAASCGIGWGWWWWCATLAPSTVPIQIDSRPRAGGFYFPKFARRLCCDLLQSMGTWCGDHDVEQTRGVNAVDAVTMRWGCLPFWAFWTNQHEHKQGWMWPPHGMGWDA